MELGNLLFGNSRDEFELDRGYQDWFCDFLVAEGFDCYAVGPYKWYDKDKQAYIKDNFIIRPYCWADCDCGDLHKEGCLLTLPNFENIETGFTLQWYKYPLRDAYSNKEVRDLEKFKQFLIGEK